MPKARFSPADGPATLAGLYVEAEDSTGKAQNVRMIRVGGQLQPAAL